jgi:hypothetical protein
VPITEIRDQAQLHELARRLNLRSDWHEPDEHGVTAAVHGEKFDNAGFWGENARGLPPHAWEMWVRLYVNGEAVADVSLATLFAWAAEAERP